MIHHNIQYLFNSSGLWIAFVKDRYVFNQEGSWIGWLPWKDGYAVDKSGSYLGSIIEDPNGKSRFYKFLNLPNRDYPGYPGYPGFAGYPGYPGFAGCSLLPPMAADIQLEESA